MDPPPAVLVTPYDPSWPSAFTTIEAELRALLSSSSSSSLVVAIHHVGSTSVPGLCAKPIIDVDVVAASAAAMGPVVAALTASGEYACRGDLGVAGRLALRFEPGSSGGGGGSGAGDDERRRPARNVYVVSQGCQALRNHLTVRDVLRRDAGELRDAYAAVKMGLVGRGMGGDEYTEGKTEVLLRILEEGGMGERELEEIRQMNSDVAAKAAGK